MRATPLMLAIALGLGLAAPAQDALARPETAVEKRSETLSRWIVVFEEPAAGSFRGFKPGDSRRPKLAATSPAATGARKYDARSVEATAYLDYLADLRRTRLADASVRLGRPLEPRYIYQHAMNGVALDLTAGEAARLRELPGVEAV
ncbi:MAG: protease inhibitor I9 family protein, partial [Arenimonas sp.]|nr:protease inhibitor I9 family protein [Arenimonas sp.]